MWSGLDMSERQWHLGEVSKKAINVDKYKGKWIALHPRSEQVVSHHRTLVRAERQAKKKGIEHPVMEYVPKSDGYFVGGA